MRMPTCTRMHTEPMVGAVGFYVVNRQGLYVDSTLFTCRLCYTFLIPQVKTGCVCVSGFLSVGTCISIRRKISHVIYIMRGKLSYPLQRRKHAQILAQS